jgi:hypothetical protein
MAGIRLNWLLSGAVATALFISAGCDRAEPDPPQQVRAIRSELPLQYADNTAHAEVALALPEAVKALPELHAELYREELAALQAFQKTAASDRTGEGAEMLKDMPPFSDRITWRVTADTPDLLGLAREESFYSGGAHPNSKLSGMIVSKREKRAVPLTDLLQPSGYSRLDQALCEAIKAAKRDRTGDETISGEFQGCPAARQSQATLAPSDQSGKAAGLLFLYGPYELGAYAEGSYEVVVPADAFADALRPEWREDFGGRPARPTKEEGRVMSGA